MVRLAVNIVTFNSAWDITACLQSLHQQTLKDLHIHILDNASTDETLQRIEPFDVEYLLRSPVNTGFCKAHNELVRRFPSEYVLFLNPDTILRPMFTEELVRALDARPDAASASGRTQAVATAGNIGRKTISGENMADASPPGDRSGGVSLADRTIH